MKLTINGAEVEAREGQNVLEAALDAGIYIPHLCKHPDLEAVGGCRLCMVEIEGQDEPVCACKTQVVEGMVVNTTGEQAEHVRKLAMELILATHPADCTGCPKYGKCELQSMYQYLGVSPARWRTKSRPVATDESNPLITHMFTRCIRCGRCVRACREAARRWHLGLPAHRGRHSHWYRRRREPARGRMPFLRRLYRSVPHGLDRRHAQYVR